MIIPIAYRDCASRPGLGKKFVRQQYHRCCDRNQDPQRSTKDHPAQQKRADHSDDAKTGRRLIGLRFSRRLRVAQNSCVPFGLPASAGESEDDRMRYETRETKFQSLLCLDCRDRDFAHDLF